MFVAAMSSFSPLCFLIMYVFLFIMLSAVLFEFMCSAAAGAAENRVRSWCYVGRPAGRVPSAHFATTNRVWISEYTVLFGAIYSWGFVLLMHIENSRVCVVVEYLTKVIWFLTFRYHPSTYIASHPSRPGLSETMQISLKIFTFTKFNTWEIKTAKRKLLYKPEGNRPIKICNSTWEDIER